MGTHPRFVADLQRIADNTERPPANSPPRSGPSDLLPSDTSTTSCGCCPHCSDVAEATSPPARLRTGDVCRIRHCDPSPERAGAPASRSPHIPTTPRLLRAAYRDGLTTAGTAAPAQRFRHREYPFRLAGTSRRSPPDLRVGTHVPAPSTRPPLATPGTSSSAWTAAVALGGPGAATASGSVMPRSIRLTRTWNTVVMMVEPPGEPVARTPAQPSRIVGAIELRGRLPSQSSIRCGATCRGEVEVGQLVEQESTSRHDHGVTAGLLDRQRVLHDVAPPVGDREVGGPPPVGQHQRRRRDGAPVVAAVGDAR